MPTISEFAVGFIGAIIGLVIGTTLLPVINSTISGGNFTGSQALLMNVVPVVATVGVLLYAVRSFI